MSAARLAKRAPAWLGSPTELSEDLELGGGLLMLIGYQTRLVALGLGVYVLIAALIAHTNFAGGNQMSHFMKNMAIVSGSLAFVAFSAGAYSLDGRKT